MSEGGNRRRLAAVLAADIVSYSRLMGENETRTLGVLRSFRSGVLQPTVTQHHGDVVKSMGDGWLIEFSSIIDAVNCAIGIQTALKGHEILKLRIGVHIGDITHDGDDLFGDGVNVAARLEQFALPGSVAISDVAHNSLDRILAAGFEDLGPQKLKNIERPVRTYIRNVTGAANLAERYAKSSAGGDKPTIAVGEIDAAGQLDAARALRDDVVDGLTDALTNQTALQLRQNDPRTAYRVGGSIRVQGDRYRVTMHLTDQRDDERFWSDRFDGDLGDFLDAADRLMQRLGTGIRFAIYSRDAEHAERLSPNESSTESELSRLALGLGGIDREAWETARRFFLKVLAEEPDNFMVNSLAGFTYLYEPMCGWRHASAEDVRTAEAYVRRGVEINAKSDFSHIALAYVLLWVSHDQAGSLLAAEKAAAISPYHMLCRASLANAQMFTGRVSEGLRNARVAVEIAEKAGLLYRAVQPLSLGNFLSGDYEQAIHWCRRSDQDVRDFPFNLLLMAAALGHAGDIAAAREVVGRVNAAFPALTLASLGSWPFQDPDDWGRVVAGLQRASLK